MNDNKNLCKRYAEINIKNVPNNDARVFDLSLSFPGFFPLFVFEIVNKINKLHLASCHMVTPPAGTLFSLSVINIRIKLFGAHFFQVVRILNT